MPGRFIVIEGPDGAGTTTHSKLLAETLRSQGEDVLLTAEPTDRIIGKFIREQLAQKTIPSPGALQLLFCADRAAHIDLEIKPALAEGKTVICDRYSLSTLVYGEALGLDAKWLADVNKPFLKPDVLIVALPGIITCLQRLGARRETDVFEKEQFQRSVYALYEKAAAADPSAHVVDTSKPMLDTTEQILRLARKAG